MSRKCHNHTLLPSPQYHEEEAKNSNSLLLHQDDCKTRKDTKYCIAKPGPNINPTYNRSNKTMNKQQQIHPLRSTAAEDVIFLTMVLKFLNVFVFVVFRISEL